MPRSHDGVDNFTICCIDPGTINLITGIFRGSSRFNLKLIQDDKFTVDHDTKSMAEAAKGIFNICKFYEVDIAVIEQQPTIGRICQARWNIFVEGGLSVALEALGLQTITISPSAAKRKLDLCTGDYARNKRVALQFAKDRIDGITSDHVADCYVLAFYYFLKYIDH